MNILQAILILPLLLLTSAQPEGGVALPPLHYPPALSQLQFFNSEKGTYFYHYDTGSNGPASFRGERREESGAVSGYFGHIDPDGVLRMTYYTADRNGYRSRTTLRYLHSEQPVGKQN